MIITILVGALFFFLMLYIIGYIKGMVNKLNEIVEKVNRHEVEIREIAKYITDNKQGKSELEKWVYKNFRN